MSVHYSPGTTSKLNALVEAFTESLPRDYIEAQEMTYSQYKIDVDVRHLGVPGYCAAVVELEKAEQRRSQNVLIRAGNIVRGQGSGVHVGGFGPAVKQRPHRVSTVTIGELLKPDVLVCNECAHISPLEAHGTPGGWLCRLYSTDERLARAAKSTSTRSLRTRQELAQHVLNTMENITYPLNTPGYQDGGRELVEARAQTYRDELANVEALLSTGKARNELLTSIQKRLVGGKNLPHGYPLDEETVLMGFSAYKPHDWSDVAQRTVAQFKIRGGGPGENTVVSLPRYAADFLLVSSSTTRCRSHTPPVRTEDDNDLVVETAVALWDPDSNGPLQSMLGAVQAARSLHAE